MIRSWEARFLTQRPTSKQETEKLCLVMTMEDLCPSSGVLLKFCFLFLFQVKQKVFETRCEKNITCGCLSWVSITFVPCITISDMLSLFIRVWPSFSVFRQIIKTFFLLGDLQKPKQAILKKSQDSLVHIFFNCATACLKTPLLLSHCPLRAETVHSQNYQQIAVVKISQVLSNLNLSVEIFVLYSYCVVFSELLASVSYQLANWGNSWPLFP